MHKNVRLFNNVISLLEKSANSKDSVNSISASNNKKIRKIIDRLSNQDRIFLLCKIIIHIYVIPLLRIVFILFLIGYQFYHIVFHENASARMNKSFISNSIWSNYYSISSYLSYNANNFIIKNNTKLQLPLPSPLVNLGNLNTNFSKINFTLKNNATVPVLSSIEKKNKIHKKSSCSYLHLSFLKNKLYLMNQLKILSREN